MRACDADVPAGLGTVSDFQAQSVMPVSLLEGLQASLLRKPEVIPRGQKPSGRLLMIIAGGLVVAILDL